MLQLLSNYGLFFAFAAFSTGALISLILRKAHPQKSAWIVGHVSGALGGIFGLIFAISTILSGETISVHFAAGIGVGSDILNLHIDSLAAFFIATISAVAIAASVFGIRYYDQYEGVYDLGAFGFFYNLFLASMLLVVCANNALLFLFAWELMAVVSYFLVIYERNNEKNISAGTLYILISQLGAALLFAAFLMLYKYTGSWDFDVMRTFAGAIPLLIQNIVLALALLGFASKAGVIPLHIWLPDAHPAAPSHVSALMSGVMLKVAIFMIIRFFVDFFPVPHAWWGLIIIILGAFSSLLGVLYALAEQDIKRMLAYSSVENIGIILMGVGASITFFSLGAAALGVVALAAALYHAVNHALFKALLFLAAGSVVHATHTRNMEEYGGLAKVMPWTSVFFLIGAVAISGLPPLSGFVSEWLTFQSLFAGIAVLPIVGKLVFLLGASSLAFTGGLAAACFVKAFGVTFLARPRSHVYDHSHEGGLAMQLGMGLLASFTILFGLGAGTIAPLLGSIVSNLRGISIGAPLIASPAETIQLGTFSSLAMPLVAMALTIGFVSIFALTKLMTRNRKVVVARTWDCGAPLSPRMEITSAGFSRSLIMIFRGLLRPTMQTEIEYHDATSRYFTKSRTVSHLLPNIYHRYIYRPVALFIERGSHETRRIQTGNLNTYLLYMFLTLLVLLFWALK
jgi:hydrogenase-4 component B